MDQLREHDASLPKMFRKAEGVIGTTIPGGMVSVRAQVNFDNRGQHRFVAAHAAFGRSDAL